MEEAFRKLRAAWFQKVLYNPPHEREWETPEREELREADNVRCRAAYDRDTERIIAGEAVNVAPRCWFDVGKP